MSAKPPPSGDPLVCDQLGVGLPGRPLLATVHAQLQPGRFTAILGPNGAGKSTLLSMLSGQRAPRSGSVGLGGRVLGRISAQELARLRAVLPQETAVAFDFTVQEVVEMGRFPHRQAPSRHEARIAQDAMQATGVAHLATRGVNTLSGGERARAHLARALAQIWEPRPDGATRWLLLDEPTAALDLAHQHQAMALVRRWAVVKEEEVMLIGRFRGWGSTARGAARRPTGRRWRHRTPARRSAGPSGPAGSRPRCESAA